MLHSLILPLALCFVSAPPVAGSRSVLDYGARPGDGKDDAPSIQRCIDAGPGLIYLPGGTYTLGSPLATRGRDRRLFGDGPGATTIGALGTYSGPLVTVGLTPPPQANYRPLVPPGTYDASVTGPRYALATGPACAAGVALPLTFGGSAGQPPDYYQGTQTLTVDAYLTLPAPPPENTFLFGCRRSDQGGNPWQVMWSLGRCYLYVETADGTRRIPGGTGGRLSWAFNPSNGYAEAWQERKQVSFGVDVNWGAGGKPCNTTFAVPDGFGPFSIGGGNGSCSLGTGDLAVLSAYGLRVVRGDVYRRGGVVQLLVSGSAVTDQTQFFDPVGDACLGLLPLTDTAPGTVAVDTPAGRTILHWVGPQQWEDTSGIELDRLTLAGRMQPCVLIGQQFGLSVTHCRITGAAQAIGCLGVGYGQPLWLSDLTLDGLDAPVCLYRQVASGDRLSFPFVGRDGVRLYGGWGHWNDVFIGRTMPYTRTFFRGLGHADGALHDLSRWMVDNEDRASAGPPFEFLNGPQKPMRVRMRDVSVSQGNANPFVRLVGGGPATSRIDADGLDCTPLGCAAEVVGAGWSGTVDVGGLGSALIRKLPE